MTTRDRHTIVFVLSGLRTGLDKGVFRIALGCLDTSSLVEVIAAARAKGFVARLGARKIWLQSAPPTRRYGSLHGGATDQLPVRTLNRELPSQATVKS